MITTVFICPICSLPLTTDGRRCFCGSGHSFDMASEGYVNLLRPGEARAKIPGDNKKMVAARRSFFEGGYYEVLRDRLIKLAAAELPEGAQLTVDVGCGEGYYTGALADALAQKGCRTVGFDASKFAVKAAAKRYKNVSFAAALCGAMPFAEASADLITNVFAPLDLNELMRIAKDGAPFIYAVPTPRHLFELKEVLYEKPYLNKRENSEYDGFDFIRREECSTVIRLRSGEDISNLFAMTPYYWRTPREAAERLYKLNELTVEIGFDFLIYRRRER
ncbi:MAG: methyltransferase domain-containing protein [Clostridia bacterium]|nr:methyltransferase domain-containing protein [Clostridia bacterium]